VPRHTSSSTLVNRFVNALDDLARVGATDLTGVIIPGSFVCSDTVLTDVDFKSSKFYGETHFRRCTFRCKAQFWSEFFEGCYFDQCTFEEKVEFDHAHFHREAHLGGNTFRGPVSLQSARCDGAFHICGIDPEVSQPELSDSSKKSNYISELELDDAAFKSYSCFKFREFGRIRLQKAQFQNAPDFLGSKIPDNVVFSRANFVKTGLVEDPQYMILMLTSQSERDDVAILTRVLLRLYGIVSESGTNLERPLLLFLSSSALFWVFYIACNRYVPLSNSNGYSLFSFTLRQVVSPFDAVSKSGFDLTYDLFGPLSSFVSIIASLQSASAIAFSAMFFHALYRYFTRD
jgi:Pentapeptide repeats (9 copies)